MQRKTGVLYLSAWKYPGYCRRSVARGEVEGSSGTAELVVVCSQFNLDAWIGLSSVCKLFSWKAKNMGYFFNEWWATLG